jgi:glycosyltransferase involved in cell wall biosynthesis
MQMTFSVVIPNFNHGRLLPRAVVALMVQRPLPIEIFIINDGSTDDSRSVIEALKSRFDCIQPIHHERNYGVVAGLNEGLCAATGDFVYFAAADDFALPPLFARANDALRQHTEASFFCARVVLVSPSGEILGFRPFMQPSARASLLAPRDVRKRFVKSDQWCVGPAVIYRRSRLLDAGGFDESMGAFTDGIVVRRLAFESGFYFDPTIGAAWEIYPKSFSARSALSVRENIRIVTKAANEVRQSFPPDIRNAYADLLSRRLRFNMARLWVVFEKGPVDITGLAEVLQFEGYSRKVLKLAARLPFTRYALLAWMALVLRPYGIGAILAGSYRAVKARLLDTTAVKRAIAQARAATLDRIVEQRPLAEPSFHS